MCAASRIASVETSSENRKCGDVSQLPDKNRVAVDNTIVQRKCMSIHRISFTKIPFLITVAARGNYTPISKSRFTILSAYCSHWMFNMALVTMCQSLFCLFMCFVRNLSTLNLTFNIAVACTYTSTCNLQTEIYLDNYLLVCVEFCIFKFHSFSLL